MRSRKPKVICNTSGGLASAVALDRAIIRYGRSNIISVFADTMDEDEDLYRFIDDLDNVLGVTTVRLQYGMDLWQLCDDKAFLPNVKKDKCSQLLKRDLLDKFILEHIPAIQIIGFGSYELDRIRRSSKLIKYRWDGWVRGEYPLHQYNPRIEHPDTLREIVEGWGLQVPRLYDEGFEHNNCGGFCFKMGMRQAAHLLKARPDTYAYHAAEERKWREKHGKDQTVLYPTVDGKLQSVTLDQFKCYVQNGDISLEAILADGGSACDCMGVMEE